MSADHNLRRARDLALLEATKEVSLVRNRCKPGPIFAALNCAMMRIERLRFQAEPLASAQVCAGEALAVIDKMIADSCPGEFDDEWQKGYLRGLKDARDALAKMEAAA